MPPLPPDSNDYTKVHLLQWWGCVDVGLVVWQTFSNQLCRMIGSTLTAHWIFDNMTVIILINIQAWKSSIDVSNYYL